MRAYIAITGVVFALLALAHFARLFAEGFSPLKNPIFLLTTALAVGLSVWSCRLLMRR